jgi:hypothetical protein
MSLLRERCDQLGLQGWVEEKGIKKGTGQGLSGWLPGGLRREFESARGDAESLRKWCFGKGCQDANTRVWIGRSDTKVSSLIH